LLEGHFDHADGAFDDQLAGGDDRTPACCRCSIAAATSLLSMAKLWRLIL
jgi:hypothetical protein